MIVNNDCSSWYNRVGDFWCRYGREEIKICVAKDQLVRFLRATPPLSARPMATIAMTIKCEQFILYFNLYDCNTHILIILYRTYLSLRKDGRPLHLSLPSTMMAILSAFSASALKERGEKWSKWTEHSSTLWTFEEACTKLLCSQVVRGDENGHALLLLLEQLPGEFTSCGIHSTSGLIQDQHGRFTNDSYPDTSRQEREWEGYLTSCVLVDIE